MLGQLRPQFLADLTANRPAALQQHPNHWAADPASLVTTSTLHAFTLGTGTTIFSTLLPLLESADSDLLLVTCFWAPSPSLTTLRTALLSLSAKALARGSPPITARICLSSVSPCQKLRHTSRPSGREYAPDEWARELGLPTPAELPGVRLRVRSVFARPFSVMHPKFAVVDGRVVALPSCNVSWEAWLEGCVVLSGGVVGCFVRFWARVWAAAGDELLPGVEGAEEDVLHCELRGGPGALLHVPLAARAVPTLFLPSPHTRNPRFRPFPWQRAPPAPRTPLNAFLLAAFDGARGHVYMQTPNLTAPPVLAALRGALGRGVDVHVVTSARLMVLEQLVTAGTTTARCVRRLVARHAAPRAADAEAAMPRGRLRVDYYRARAEGGEEEPVQSHLKLTVFDHCLVVLGSGNMDRASWYTSQELGVAFEHAGAAADIERAVGDVMRGRTETVYDSALI